jgi:hypothetical protein
VTRTTTLAAVALATLAGSGLLSGCGGAQPGVAAQVGDDTISVNRVNELTAGYCSAYERQLEGDAQALPLGVLSAGILQRLALSSAAEQLADEYDVEPTAQYKASLATLTKSTEVLDDDEAEARIEVESSPPYVADILTTIGTQDLVDDGVSEPTSDDALARGQELLSQWLADQEPDIDPSYGFVLDSAQPEPVDSSTSFAVSDTAKAGSADESDPDYARGLPASQRCP